MKIIFFIIRLILNIIYFFMKLIPTNNKKILMLSRQSNDITLDFQMIKNELIKREPKLKIVILNKRIGSGFIEKIKYAFHILVQMYHLATSKVCIIESYIIPVSMLKHKKDLQIIQLWHAMGAIKKFGYQSLDLQAGRSSDVAKAMCMHRNYDAVISGSDAMIPYFSEAFDVEKNKFLSFGLPRMDYLYNENKRIKKKIYKSYPQLKKNKVILYVPTFRKKKDNKTEELIENVNLDNYTLIIKGHPNKKIKIKDKRILTCPEFSSLELLTVADYIITDYSAISIEACILDKPIYFYLYDYEEYTLENGLNIDLFKEMPSATFKTAKVLMNNLRHKKYDYESLEKFKNRYVKVQDGTSTIKIVDYIIGGMNDGFKKEC